MAALQYEAPATIEDAVALLAKSNGDGRVLAGGTDLLVQMRTGLADPKLIVDVKKIARLREIKAEGGGWRVGAAVAGAELTEHEAICKAWPGLAESFDLIGSTQIQGRASMGGNLCNASPAADTVPALVAIGAKVTVIGPNGSREVPVEAIPSGPRQTSLKPGEFVVDFILPERRAGTGDAYLRLIPRTEMDIAVVGVGVCLSLDGDGTCTAAKVALGAVAPTVVVVDEAAKILVGSKLDDATLAKLDAACAAVCKPIDDKRGTIAYRNKIAGVLTRRAVAIAAGRARK